MAYHRIHSTSGFIIREAFDDADDRDKITQTNWSVSQICFVAADVASKDTAGTSANIKRSRNVHPLSKPIVDTVSQGWYFNDPVFMKALAYTLNGDMDRNVIPTRVTNRNLSLCER